VTAEISESVDVLGDMVAKVYGVARHTRADSKKVGRETKQCRKT